MNSLKDITRNKWHIIGFAYLVSIAVLLVVEQLNFAQPLSLAQIKQSAIPLNFLGSAIFALILGIRYAMNIYLSELPLTNISISVLGIALFSFVWRYQAWGPFVSGANTAVFLLVMLCATCLTYFLITLKPLFYKKGDA